jgi:glycosyltransferase involved in cell wall biosynthesis
MATIYYFCPDATQPSGGIKTLYRQVQLLNDAGQEAAIVHQNPGFRVEWHGYKVPVVAAAELPPLNSGDCLVIPEVMPGVMAGTSGFAGRRLVIALSWQPAYYQLRPDQRWQDFGIEEVITCSPTIQRWVRWRMGIEPQMFERCVDPGLYYRPDPGLKEQQIAYTSRKRGLGAHLQGVLERKRRFAGHYSWQALHGLSEGDYAAALRSALVFLPSTLQEGMHISVLEAMACGALVVGFNGVGGGDYMEAHGPDQNCILAENGNLPELGMLLEEVLGQLLEDPDRHRRVVRNALATAQRYQDAQAERDSLLAIFG